jgi:basic amino acid/polyamine antiporter, APA family
MASEVTGGSSGAGGSGVFLRKASGVVRAWSPFDGWIYNVFAINVVISLGFGFYTALVGFPSGSLPWAIIIAGVMCLFHGVTYAVLVGTMPRSGGDYVFQSRLLNGFVSVLFAFTSIVLTQALWMGLVAFSAINLVLCPFLTLLGLQWNQQWMMDLSTWMQTTSGFLIVSGVVVVWGALVNIWGMRFYALAQRYVFYVAAATMALILGILLFGSKASFIASFNATMVKTTGIHNAYAKVIANAHDTGLATVTGTSLSATINMSIVMLLALMFLTWGVAQGGEIKSANSLRAQFWQMPGAVLFSMALGAALAALLVSRLGVDFISAAGYLAMNGGDANILPFPALFGTFVAIMGKNSVLMILVALCFQAWFWMWYPNIIVAQSRILLAMSIDRLLPAWFGKVSQRRFTPVNSIIFLSIMGAIFVFLVAYTTLDNYLLAVILPSIMCFGVTNFAGAIMPWRRRKMYQDSPAASLKLFGIPLVTITGTIFTIYSIWVTYKLLTDAAYGVNATMPLVIVGILFAISAVLYVVARSVRHSEGIAVEKAYAQIPIE